MLNLLCFLSALQHVFLFTGDSFAFASHILKQECIISRENRQNEGQVERHYIFRIQMQIAHYRTPVTCTAAWGALLSRRAAVPF